MRTVRLTSTALLLLMVACRADESLDPRPAVPAQVRPSAMATSGASSALSASLSPHAAIAFSSVPGLNRAYGINDDGLVVGDYGGNNIAAVWSQSSGFQSIGRLDGSTACCSALSGVNGNGVAVGFSHTNAGVSVLQWDRATDARIDLAVPGRAYGQDINDQGDVVATDYSGFASPYYQASGTAAVRLPLAEPFVAADPRAINNARFIAGVAWAPDGKFQAVAWPTSTTDATPLGGLGGEQSWAQDVNESQDVVGWSEVVPGSGTHHAVLWPGGGAPVDLSTWPNGCTGASEASAINDRGVIVGQCDGQAVLWTAAEGMRPLSPDRFTSAQPYAINNRNEIVGIVNGFGSGMWTVVLGSGIEAGDRHTCAVRGNGEVLCWGFADQGQIAVPNDLGSVASVMPGGYHTCAIRSTDATVACWGTNSDGQAQVPDDLGPVRALGAGTSHTCAIGMDGTLRCWGRNTEGQTTVPSDLGPVVQVDGGVAFTCALKVGGTVRCWGSNIDQNTNPAGQSNVPAGLTGVRAIAVGFYHVCAVRDGGALTCWGYNTDGQAASPAGLGSVQQMGATYHDCALQAGGALRCWGFNGFGQTNVPAGLGELERVAVGGYHTCVLRTEATISCWGLNQFGELEVPAALRPATLLAQTITFGSVPPDPALPGGTYNLQATGGGSGKPVVFSSLTPGVCSVSGATATFVTGGTCTVAADQAGNGSFAVAPQATQSFPVGSPNRAPLASAGGPYAAAEGSEVSFDASGTTDPDGNAVSFEWTFGDGGTATTADPTVKPTHVYADNGSYAVTLKVTDAGGLTASATATATITNVAPTGQFVRPATAPENAKLVLSLAPVTDPGSADVIQYAFDCGDGKGYGALTATNNRPCVPADNGTLAVRAKVQDDDGGLTEYTGSIAATNVAPTATFTVPTKVISEGDQYSLSLTKPIDAAGDLLYGLSYSITCPGYAGIAPRTFNTASTDCRAYDNFTGAVTGQVSDKDGGQTVYSPLITIVNVAPYVYIPKPTVVGRRADVIFTALDAVNDRDWVYYCNSTLGQVCGTGLYMTVDWGDGSGSIEYPPQQNRERLISRVYSIPGNYTVTISARDKDGGVGTATQKVTIK